MLPSAKTHEEQQRAVQALAFKCDVLWAILDAVERGHVAGRPAARGGQDRAVALSARPRLVSKGLRHDQVRQTKCSSYPNGSSS